MTHANSTFDIDSLDDQVLDEQPGAKIGRLKLTKTFHGDIEGQSTVEALTALSSDGAGRAYVGIERIAATIHGRSGTFVLHHTALESPSDRETTWTVVSGTGTGELTGLRGKGEIINEPDGGHRFNLDYELD